MSTATLDLPPAVPAESRVTYLNATYGIKSWLLTKDHKRIGLLYLATITIMFMFGGLAAFFMRLQLIEPQGALVEPETYNKLFTIHGIIMVFFFLMPSIPATLGNFCIPLMIGARDVAFPKLNLLSWYIFVTGCCLALVAIFSGGVDTGWTFYTPYSSTYSHTARHLDGNGHLYRGVLVHSHRPEFHRHDSQDARSGTDLVPAAALHLGDVRDEHHLYPRHAGNCNHSVSPGA